MPGGGHVEEPGQGAAVAPEAPVAPTQRTPPDASPGLPVGEGEPAPPKRGATTEAGELKTEAVFEETVVTAAKEAQNPLDDPNSTSIITEQDIGKLFIAGILPGILAATMYMMTVALIGWARPKFLPSGPRSSWKERLRSVRDVWATLLLFIFVIGGLYGGLFTPTEAGGMGAGGAFLIGLARGKLSRPEIRRSLLQAVRTAAAVLTVLIGALIFGYFLTVTQTPQKVTAFLTGLGLGRYGLLALIMLMYLVLGCLMDALAMIILTIPIIFPVITQLGFDPIWFGVIIVMTVELGLIHPPVGMNVFVIKSVVQDVSFSTIFLGVLPFIVTDLIRLVILIAFPILALYLPSHM